MKRNVTTFLHCLMILYVSCHSITFLILEAQNSYACWVVHMAHELCRLSSPDALWKCVVQKKNIFVSLNVLMGELRSFEGVHQMVVLK